MGCPRDGCGVRRRTGLTALGAPAGERRARGFDRSASQDERLAEIWPRRKSLEPTVGIARWTMPDHRDWAVGQCHGGDPSVDFPI